MPPLLNAESLSKSYGHRQLFKEVSLCLFKGEKVGLIGPNGMGKSTFLKILSGIEVPDEGAVSLQQGVKIGYVPQTVNYPDLNLEDYLLASLSDDKELDEYEKTTHISIILGKLGFDDGRVKINTLSGGWKKRLDLAYALLKNPDVLLLDEPTNHLDIEGILWLENFLKRSHCTCLITSHDRNFLETITSRIFELNPCYPQGSFSVDGPYSTFLEKRDQFLQGQAQYQKSLASKVRREIDWLRQTPQARTTKSRSRIQEANRLIGELSDVKSRNSSSKAQIEFTATGRLTKKLLTVNNISKSMKDTPLFSKLNFTLSPGVRIAVIGGNGTGKSTLMKLLLGELKPDSGTIKKAEGLKIVYFDQQREELPEDVSVKEALSPNGDTVHFQGRSMHVHSFGKRFLFTPERLQLPVRMLSGGEKARILIARLMTQSADILLLDEPTNDLDIETLEILEESLRNFPGAIVFITHDRYMLNDLATIFLGLGFGGDEYFFADYYQCERYLQEMSQKKAPKAKTKTVSNNAPKKQKLSYKEKTEYQNIEKKIQKAEAEVERLHKLLESPTLSDDTNRLQEVCNELKKNQDEIERLYMRWQELESKL